MNKTRKYIDLHQMRHMGRAIYLSDILNEGVLHTEVESFQLPSLCLFRV